MLDKRDSLSATPAPTGFDLLKDDEQEDIETKVQAQGGIAEQISAADYDPSLDRREDEEKRVRAVVEHPQNDVEMIEEGEDGEDEEDFEGDPYDDYIPYDEDDMELEEGWDPSMDLYDLPW